MADLVLGGAIVQIIQPATPIFRVIRPVSTVQVMPVPGPPGTIPDVIDGGNPNSSSGA